MNGQSLCILGRQPPLGLAELESLYGADKIQPAGAQAALINIDPSEIDFKRLGGSVKLAKVLAATPTANWREVEKFLIKSQADFLPRMPEGKLQLGLSTFGFDITTAQLEATGLTLKKVLRKSGHSVRLIPNKSLQLGSAQVIHNHLTGPNGCELVLVKDGTKTTVGRTIQEQDIASYTLRDRERPKRDARVGMLPPKLAQIIINLANPTTGGVILDPFCGTGVLLQEALLMGYGAYGSDIDPRMVEYSEANINWLKAREEWLGRNIDEHGSTHVFLEQQDATAFQNHDVIDAVASETYLGRPFTAKPEPEILAQTASDCNLIIKKFLRHIAIQLPPATPLCLAVPAWQIRPNEFKHLPLIDQIGELGYTQVSFEHAPDNQLLYFRKDQFVARELLVIRRK